MLYAFVFALWGDKAPLPEHIELQIKTEQHKFPIYQLNCQRFFLKIRTRNVNFTSQKSAAYDDDDDDVHN